MPKIGKESLQQHLIDALNGIGDLNELQNDLGTDNLVEAINIVADLLGGRIDLSNIINAIGGPDLTETDKYDVDRIAGQITTYLNNFRDDINSTDITTMSNSDKMVNLIDAAVEIFNTIGNILNLETNDKSSVVAAINELVDADLEDLILRDALADILEDEDAEITDNDDMASLITKTDELFDNIKQKLITALTNKGVKNIDMTTSWNELISKIQNFDSYTEPVLYLYDNGNDFTYNTGGFTFARTSGNGGSGVANDDHLYVHVYANANVNANGSGSAYCETTNFIDITNYKSLYVNLDYRYSRSGGSMGTGSFYIDLINESGDVLKTLASGAYNHVGYEGKLDIRSYAGNVKIRFRTSVNAITTRSDSKLMIYHARLEKAELPSE